MRKRRGFVCIIAFCLLFLWGCNSFTSKESESLYNDIKALKITEVSVADEAQVQSLEDRYQALSTELQKEITNYSRLEKAQKRVEESKEEVRRFNERIDQLKNDLPPEALVELDLMQMQYDLMLAGNREQIEADSLKAVQERAEKWYGEDSLYVQLKQLGNKKEYAQAVALTDEALKPSVSAAVQPYYMDLLGEYTVIYLDQLIAEGKTEDLLKNFNKVAFSKFPEGHQKDFSNKVMGVMAKQAQALLDQGKTDEALAYVETVWDSVLNAVDQNPLCSIVGDCCYEKALAKYEAGKYEDAVSLCRKALNFPGDLPVDKNKEMLSLYTDAVSGQADAQIRKGSFGAAHELLTKAIDTTTYSNDRTRLNQKLQELYTAARPKNGAVVTKGDGVNKGYGKFEVKVESDQDVLLRVTETDWVGNATGKASLLYVRAGQKASFSFQDGYYRVEYKEGSNYVDAQTTFEDGGSWTRPGYIQLQLYDMSFKTTHTRTGVEYTVNTLNIK